MIAVYSSPVIPDPGRWPIRLRLCLGLAAMGVICRAGAVDGDEAPGVAARRKALPPIEFFKPATTVVQARFQYESALKMLDAGKMREFFDDCVQGKVEIVDQLCGLTGSQKQVLQLAGRGDIKRGLERAVEIERQFQLVQDDIAQITELCQEALYIRRSLITIADDGSLFVKALEKNLTPSQSAKYQPLRELYRVGARALTNRRGSREGLMINLQGARFADGDLVLLADVPTLHSLCLCGTRVTDAGMPHLTKLTTLRWLDLSETGVSDTGLAELREMTRLESLELRGTSVTDAGMAHLNGLTGLQRLDLRDTPVTGASLANLKGLTSLQELWLSATQATNGGAADLQHALPGLKVVK